MPQYAAGLLFASCVPQTFWFYEMLWADTLSDEFLEVYQKAVMWICVQLGLEVGAGGVSRECGVCLREHDRLRSCEKR